MTETIQNQWDPLNHRRAAFTNHSTKTHHQACESGPSKFKGLSDRIKDEVGYGGEDQAESDWSKELNRLQNGIRRTNNWLMIDSSPPKINPLYLVSQSNGDFDGHLMQTKLDALEAPLELNGENGDARIIHRSSNISQSSIKAPIHITKVTHDKVEISTGPATSGPKKLVQRVGNVFRKEGKHTTSMQEVSQGKTDEQGTRVEKWQSPVSEGDERPPENYRVDEVNERTETKVPDGDQETTIKTERQSKEIRSPNENGQLSPVTEQPDKSPRLFTSNLTYEPQEVSPDKRDPSPIPNGGLLAVPPTRQPSTSSTASRAGSLAVVRNNRLASQRSPDPSKDIPNGTAPADILKQSATSSTTQDGRPLTPLARKLSASSTSSSQNQPATPHSPPPRMSRRSTGPSVPMPTRSPLVHAHSLLPPRSPPQRSQTMVPGIDGAALDSDILAQAENIRRERLERRQKKAAAPQDEQSPEREATQQRQPTKEDARVLVGNLIGEDHVNYVLMYNMLTGIRIGAKIKRPLTDEDYTAKHKFSFDIVGNELTPSARYDFKFKDYAPWVFRDLRDDHFHLDPADYLLSLTAKYILSELGSPGKSGSFFYFSRDYRFIIKTISHSEHKFLRSILKDYHHHVIANPHTLLSRFYGLHRVKLPRGRKIHFVIMNNLFPPHRDIHETYDLKGSAYGREYPEEKARKNPKAVLKDKNWVNRGRTLELGPEKRALLSEQLRRDMEFLRKMTVMDYSLLVGIHNMERGNKDNLRENQLTMFHVSLGGSIMKLITQPEMHMRRKPTVKEASHLRKAVRRSDPKSLDVTSQLPSSDSSDRRHFLFYQDEGGLRATNETNGPMDVIYYLGVIDICTPYNTAKKIEHFWKSMTEDRRTISCVDPTFYGQRFLNFLLSIMRKGDINLRPEGLMPEREEVEKPVGGQYSRHPTLIPEQNHDFERTVIEERPERDFVDGEEVLVGETEQRPAVVGHLKAE